MAMIRNALLSASIALGLAACGTEREQGNTSVIVDAFESRFNPGEVSQLTATRASLEASGFDQPLLVGTLSQPIDIRAGLLLAKVAEGVEFWRGGDGSLIKTDNGVVRGTVGIPYDLYGADTSRTVQAFSGRSTQAYPRVFRHLNALNQLDVVRYFCTLKGPVAETIVVFDRQHRTHRHTERCIADKPDALGITRTFENHYWKDPNRLFFWRSEQWISDKTGTILLERVFE